MSDQPFQEQVDTLRAEVAWLSQRLQALESRPPQRKPYTMLLSHSFFERAFAVYGHVFVAGLIIAVPVYVLILLLAVAFRP